MADVTITTFGVDTGEASGTFPWIAGQKKMVWTDEDTGYIFYGALDADDYIVAWQKTTDGGATWSTAAQVGSLIPWSMDIWFDKWTSGDTGTIIHLATILNAGAVYYNQFDTNDDSFSGEGVIDSLTAGNATRTLFGGSISITKARGGNLYIGSQASGTAGQKDSFLRSTDGGSSWTDRAGFIEAADLFTLMPGNETDNQDIIAIYQDISADALSLKIYDDSGNSWSETSISTGIDVNSAVAFNISAAPRHSDGHSIVVAGTENAPSTGDLKAWDINTSASITTLTDIISSTTFFNAAVAINQQNDDIYVTYLQGSIGTTIGLDFVKSTDGGATWGTPATYTAASDDDFWCPTVDISIGTYGGRFEVSWYKRHGTGDAQYTIYTNVDNSVEISGQSAALSGTIFGSSEEDIRAGGKTLIITLTGLTWNADIGSDNSQTTALINGLDSAQAEGTGWDAVVKAGLDFDDVTRDSDTVVTITFPAFPSYFISAPEIITATIQSTSAS